MIKKNPRTFLKRYHLIPKMFFGKSSWYQHFEVKNISRHTRLDSSLNLFLGIEES